VNDDELAEAVVDGLSVDENDQRYAWFKCPDCGKRYWLRKSFDVWCCFPRKRYGYKFNGGNPGWFRI
jgi:ribosomal protein L37AE/L43A